MANDWIASLDRLKQGMNDPSNQSIRETRWYDEYLPQALGFLQPLDELVRGAAPKPNPQEGVEAVPFGSLFDPLSAFVGEKGMKAALSMKGVKSNFKDAQSFIDYIGYVTEHRQRLEKLKSTPVNVLEILTDSLKKKP